MWQKKFNLYLSTAALMAVVVVLDSRLGSTPPMGRLLDPFHGFWRNAVPEHNQQLELPAHLPLQAEASVTYDERGVPHIFAANDHDLYFLQGYLTACDRLWQMEFQTHAASGRVSEFVGPKAIDYDLEQRRCGMTYAAEQSLQAFASDANSMAVINAFTDGVNCYMGTLSLRDLPLEYKLLNYRPEPWSALKSVLLLKHMAKMLTWSEQDRENSALLELLGPALFNDLYPDPRYGPEPVVPPMGIMADSSLAAPKATGTTAYWPDQFSEPSFIGSNNWAVAGSRTASGRPILCNDPHLRLMLPAIWYEVQLTAPGIHCRGVSLPGAPGIIIGFNDSVAWGVTNAGRDVKDHFRIEFQDKTRAAYRTDKGWETTSKRIETIKVCGGADVVDTVVYTHFGPVDVPKDEAGNAYALRWTAHRPSNEMTTFYQLNRANNVNDYHRALDSYNCPPQNFAFADVRGNIALRQQGFFPLRYTGEGRFLMDTTLTTERLGQGIPFAHNPQSQNPARGFVSSANQTAADSSYPYYYTGMFEQFRNRTINSALQADSAVTVDAMMALQLSDFNLLAAEALPELLKLLDTNRLNTENERLALNEIRGWDFVNRAEDIGPTIFEIWWDELHNILYDELNNPAYRPESYYRDSWIKFAETHKAKIDIRDKHYAYPTPTTTIRLLREANHPWFDNHFTADKKETARDVVSDAFYWTAVKFGDIIKYKFSPPQWGPYKGTRVQHMLRMDALSSPLLIVGGSKNAPNAMTQDHGPSWRMVVEPGPNGPTAWGVYPGGQSGNPGHPQYLGGIQKWVNGEYYPLVLFRSAEDATKAGHKAYVFKLDAP